MLGMWKDYEDLENSLSMAELNATLAAKRDAEYQHQKFQAALQGVDLDKNQGSSPEEPKSFQDFADKVKSKRAGTGVDDIINLRGNEAAKAGIGIGNGLDYEIAD